MRSTGAIKGLDLRTIAMATTFILLASAVHATCGTKGGPGYRGPDGRCVGWASLIQTCGSPPTLRCTPEKTNASNDEGTTKSLRSIQLVDLSANAEDIVGVPRIVDGDTIQIDSIRIRLEGIDAPETDQLCLDANGNRWTCGIEARDQLKQKAGGKSWTCHAHGTDRYGRALATCDVDGENIQRWLVQNGWALSFVRYSHRYDADQEKAREIKAGLWAGAFIAPWDWRHRSKETLIRGAISVPVNSQSILLAPASAAEAPSPNCMIKGNLNRKGECVYHLPGGRYYGSIKMDVGGKQWFCSAEEAEAAGCRAAKSY
jgi:endonuclease YncB( thermonuclease family)